MENTTVLDYLIVGAGPAGLQLAYFFQKNKRNYVVLESGESPAEFFKYFPRHRRLISINKYNNYYSEPDFNLRHDWNSLLTEEGDFLFKNYSKELYPHADDLVRYMTDFAKQYQLNINYNAKVVKISKQDDFFCVTDVKGNKYFTKNVFLATGATHPFIPNIPGVELASTYKNCPRDAEYFSGKRVLIMGASNSAFEIANEIAGSAAIVRMLDSPTSEMKMAWQTHYVGDLRAINNTFLDMVQLKSMHFVFKGTVEDIKKNAKGEFEVLYREQAFAEKNDSDTYLRLLFDEVIIASGWNYIPYEIFDETCQPKVDAMQKFLELDSSWQTSVLGLYCIGTTMQQLSRKTALGFIHGYRYAIRTLNQILENQNFNIAFPSISFDRINPASFDALLNYLLLRLSTTSALYQLYGFACDLIVIEEDKWIIYPELTKKFVLDHLDLFSKAHQFIFVSLNYGFDVFYPGMDSLKFKVLSTPPAYIHPVFEFYSESQLKSIHRIDESLLVRFVPDPGIPWEGNYIQMKFRLADYLAKVFKINIYLDKGEKQHGYAVTKPEGGFHLVGDQ